MITLLRESEFEKQKQNMYPASYYVSFISEVIGELMKTALERFQSTSLLH